MNRQQAIEVANLFREIGGFSEVRVDHRGFYSTITPELENDGRWEVQLWSVSAKAGNRNITKVEHAVEMKEAKLVAKQAKGKANERDKAALARMAAERMVNAE